MTHTQLVAMLAQMATQPHLKGLVCCATETRADKARNAFRDVSQGTIDGDSVRLRNGSVVRFYAPDWDSPPRPSLVVWDDVL